MITIEQIKEYTKCPQFGDKDYGKWGTLRLEQRKAYRDLIDIIEGMEQELEIQNKKYNKLYVEDTKKLNEKDKEIERLNNIINELEESLKDDKEEYNKDLDLETKELYNEYWRGYSVCADKNLAYLQELKGDGSNE